MSNDIEKAIRSALSSEFDRLVAEETVAAQERLATRIGEHLAKTAMSVSRFYDLRAMHDQIIITVRNEIKP